MKLDDYFESLLNTFEQIYEAAGDSAKIGLFA